MPTIVPLNQREFTAIAAQCFFFNILSFFFSGNSGGRISQGVIGARNATLTFPTFTIRPPQGQTGSGAPQSNLIVNPVQQQSSQQGEVPFTLNIDPQTFVGTFDGKASSYSDCSSLYSHRDQFCNGLPEYDPASKKSLHGDCLSGFSE
jgi:hypothetical protein